jgi:hypothetical protein
MARNKTLRQYVAEAAQYAVETLDIERALVVRQARDEDRASAALQTGIGDEILNASREFALRAAAERLRSDANFAADVESMLYAHLEKIPSYISRYTNRLDTELARDEAIVKAAKDGGE